MKSIFKQTLVSLFLTVSVFSLVNAQNNVFTISNLQTGTSDTIYINKIASTTTPANSSTTSASTTSNNVACTNLFTTFHKVGSSGPDVITLQKFLNANQNAGLNGLGFYGPATAQAVKNLQYTYGINPTGNQFEKTTKLINDLNCGRISKIEMKIFIPKTITVNTSMKPMVTPNTTTKDVNGNTYVNLVKEYGNKYINKIEDLTPTSTKTQIDVATKTGFFANLEKDWNKIKENYKAYLLVFVLVLALFWFLRKAATE